MARRLITGEGDATSDRSDVVVKARARAKRIVPEGDDFVVVRTPAERKAKVRAKTRRSLAGALRDAQERMAKHKAGDRAAWEDAGPAALVGLYAILHTSVYGVEPAELQEGQTVVGAMSAAKRLIGDLGEPIYAVEFLRWTWAREKKRHAKGDGDWRVTWRQQFVSRALLTDFRVVLARSVGKIR